LQATDLPALVDEVVTLAFADAAARGIRIVSEVPQGIAAVRCDRVHVQQVLLNLIVNGMDAIGQPPAGDPRVVVGARDTGNGQVEVWVSDGGPGIASDLLSSIFEPFFTTKPCGMGMGLAISRTLVEAHGGRLWAETAARGACFRFTLQTASAAEGSA
jgi:two-component system sensor kinase FixL